MVAAGYLRIWDVNTRRELHRLHGHDGATQTLAFSADGRRLVSFGSADGFVWDLRPLRTDRKQFDPFADLLSDDGPTVYRAIWTLADDPLAPAMLREPIAPRRVDNRAERIAQLIADLASPRFPVRDVAARALAELEENARIGLLAALEKKHDLETQRRIRLQVAMLDDDLSAAHGCPLFSSRRRRPFIFDRRCKRRRRRLLERS